MGKTNKGKELGNAIYQRANGTYEARYIDRFGKQRSVYGKTITEVGRKQREKIFENEKQINVIDTKMTLDEWYDKWITVCKKHCRTTTKRTYAIQYNRLRESLGWRKLTSLNLIVLQDAFNELGSDKSRSDCKALLVDILNRAVEADLLLKNPAIGINPIIDGEFIRLQIFDFLGFTFYCGRSRKGMPYIMPKTSSKKFRQKIRDIKGYTQTETNR